MTPAARWLAALVVLTSGCGRARSGGLPEPNHELEEPKEGACHPLGHSALAKSLDEPLAVGRDLVGTLYALSRVGSTSFLWRSLDERLIPYPVVAENRGGRAGAIFGADDGNQGFALSLIPETDPTILRVFKRLSEAGPAPDSTLTTGGSTLELQEFAALSDFTLATEISPALLVGSFRTVPDDGPSAALLIVRTAPAPDAPLAVFYGEGTVLEQRTLLQVTTTADILVVRFELDGSEASAELAKDRTLAKGSLFAQGRERALQRGVSTPLGLAQLELVCKDTPPEAWTREEPAPALAQPSCSEPLPLLACVVSTGPVLADTGSIVAAAGGARVVELGRGLPSDPNGNCRGRAATLVADPRVTFSWARLEFAGGQVWLTVAGPDLELPLAVGQTVSLGSWEIPGFTWESWDGELSVRSTDTNELLLWMGQADDFYRLSSPPEFDLLPGPERCITLLECGGAVSQYALSSRLVSVVGPDGLPQPGSGQFVGYRERVQQGAYYVYNGGIEAQTAAPLCLAKEQGNARLAIWKVPGG